MTAKPLDEWPPLEAEPKWTEQSVHLGMVKRHRRSVHREACRPQGIRSPQRQFSPVKSVDAGDDGFNVLRSQHGCRRYGEAVSGPSGFGRELSRTGSKPWHVCREATRNLGEPAASRKGMRAQPTGGRANEHRAVGRLCTSSLASNTVETRNGSLRNCRNVWPSSV